jgi:hypothetical protein
LLISLLIKCHLDELNWNFYASEHLARVHCPSALATAKAGNLFSNDVSNTEARRRSSSHHWKDICVRVRLATDHTDLLYSLAITVPDGLLIRVKGRSVWNFNTSSARKLGNDDPLNSIGTAYSWCEIYGEVMARSTVKWTRFGYIASTHIHSHVGGRYLPFGTWIEWSWIGLCEGCQTHNQHGESIQFAQHF